MRISDWSSDVCSSDLPDMFVAAAAFSGAVDTNTIPVQLLAQTSGMEDGAPLAGVYGLRATQELRWRRHNPWDLADNLRSTYVELHTGNGLPAGPGGDAGSPVELAVRPLQTNLTNQRGTPPPPPPLTPQ